MLAPLRGMTLLDASEREYDDAVENLRPAYRTLKLSASGATIVVNAKALYHLLPALIPPIDRQYTIRFFTKTPDNWRDRKGKFKPIMLPADADAQFRLSQKICAKVKRLADRVDGALFERERREHGVTPPKAIDNAIVNQLCPARLRSYRGRSGSDVSHDAGHGRLTHIPPRAASACSAGDRTM